ncbi:MAG TPA: SDR family oxidoreductase [Solirubrobacteraceae bacterium]|nr:SDR family oxidoreductase [Solirubrobacteraceae bacterium]
MRVFVTGASGWIGSAVTTELIDAGHQVTGLARSEESAAAVEALGADVLRGDIEDLDLLRRGARDADAVVHLAFRHDVAFRDGDFEAAVASDRAAIEAIGGELAGSDRPLAIASGVAGLRPGALATEEERPEPFPGSGGRIENERTALALVDRGVRSMSVRFAPTVHGDGDGGFIKQIVEADRGHGLAAYVGDGANRWAAVHRSDAARLVRLGIERAPAGSVLHAVAEEGVSMREIAEAIGEGLGIPAGAIGADAAPAHFGFLARFIAMDMPVSSAITRELLDWTPTGPGLVEDIAAGHYFAERALKY